MNARQLITGTHSTTLTSKDCVELKAVLCISEDSWGNYFEVIGPTVNYSTQNLAEACRTYDKAVASR